VEVEAMVFISAQRPNATVTLLRTRAGRRVKVVEQGTGTPVVFLHSGVGSAGEWKQVFASWPAGYRLLAVDVYGADGGPGTPSRRTVDDYADQVYAAAEHVGAPVHLIGFSWGGATALRVATVAPELLATVALVEPETYGLLRTGDPIQYGEICGLRDRWRAHVRSGRWYEAFAEFIDFYNGPGSFARWPAPRRDAFLATQQSRGDLWDVLFEGSPTPEALDGVVAPVHLVEGSRTSAVDKALCDIVAKHVRHAWRTVIIGAGHMMPLTHPQQLTAALLAGIEH
jgi:pimeloyl-ACP methyl ester carboxylesterase